MCCRWWSASCSYLIKLRQNALYNIDSAKTLRKSHENPAIKELYKEFLGEPGSHVSHNLLHTKYEEKLPRGIK
jgi:iron only hydrogenase large subunit-like protein